MIAIVLLVFFGLLFPFVFVYGAVAWLLALPFIGAYNVAKPHLAKINFNPKVVRWCLMGLSTLVWILAIRSI